MRLFEFEGKRLWQQYGIAIPDGRLYSLSDVGFFDIPKSWTSFFLKAQTLTGHRARGELIQLARTAEEAATTAMTLLSKKEQHPELSQILLEQKFEYTTSLYLAITYSTDTRSAVLLLSQNGGTGIEHRSSGVQPVPIDVLIGLYPAHIRAAVSSLHLTPGQSKLLMNVCLSVWKCFVNQDCTLAEINPLVWSDNKWVALDAKVEIDDDARFRQTEIHSSDRHLTWRLPTPAEIAAWSIDRDDHRGVSGSSYIDLDGDIAVLASGGGASLACLDALVAYGGKPANYTEYSGNPPREKVRRLTEIVLSKTNLRGCWVVGATANFTDIYETLAGFLEAVKQLKQKPTYPFIIRRAGPNDEKAFAMLKQAAQTEGFDFRLFGSDTPMIATAKKMIDAVRAYTHGHSD